MILVVRFLIKIEIISVKLDLVIVVHSSLMNASVLYHDLVESASPVPTQISYQIIILLYMHIMLKMLRYADTIRSRNASHADLVVL